MDNYNNFKETNGDENLNDNSNYTENRNDENLNNENYNNVDYNNANYNSTQNYNPNFTLPNNQNNYYPNYNFTSQPKKKSNFKTYLSLVLVSSIISSTLVGGILYSVFTSKLNNINSKNTNNSIFAPSNTDSNSNTSKISYESNGSVINISKQVSPSIVGIRMTVTLPQSGFISSSGKSQSEGSGIIISKDGYIMTNYHVVEYADPKYSKNYNSTLEVFLPDSRQVEAKFIGGDSLNDIAVIKINLNDLPVANFGDSSKLQVGELAVAIGNPLGMEFAGSVTVGVVSALNRKIDTNDTTLKLIQTDAAINPGNSGGALVNSKGEIVGINTMKISDTGVEGLGFAIPINDAKPIVDSLIQYGYVKGRGTIGISGQEITQILSKQYKIPEGIYITQVLAGSGAEKAGIKKGDILISLADKDVKTINDLNSIKSQYKANDTVNAVIYRNGSNIKTTITFTEEK